MNQDGDCLTICYTEGETNKMNVWSIDRSLKFNQFSCNFSTFFCAAEPIFQKLHDTHFIHFCRWRSLDIWATQIQFASRLLCLIHTTIVQLITFYLTTTNTHGIMWLEEFQICNLKQRNFTILCQNNHAWLLSYVFNYLKCYLSKSWQLFGYWQ